MDIQKAQEIGFLCEIVNHFFPWDRRDKGCFPLKYPIHPIRFPSDFSYQGLNALLLECLISDQS